VHGPAALDSARAAEAGPHTFWYVGSHTFWYAGPYTFWYAGLHTFWYAGFHTFWYAGPHTFWYAGPYTFSYVGAGFSRPVFEPIDGGDVGMIQRREHLRFPLETGQAVWIRGEQLREHLQRDVAVQPRIARAIHLAHAARADKGCYLIGAESGTRCDSHVL
jgi:hypothetical protein